ncbi:MAG: DUF885 family protein [Gammaproteobacteria bacterium]|nr:DUF885 family protein [Gammaproteobacteria bacterium]MDH5304219.1 DUF885 family protein [Gammaproteobacteria bacterium]MDH5322172.1 DUF885 family protein [Gammaproteobacteria bacterium]
MRHSVRYALPGAQHDQLFDNSPEALLAWQAQEDAWPAALVRIGKPAEIGSRDWLSYGTLYEELAGSAATRICRSELWAASTTTAWHTDLPYVFDLQPVATPEARAETLRRLQQVASYIDTEISNLRAGLDFGFSAPRPTVQAVPGEIRALLDDDNPFLLGGEAIETFLRRLSADPEFTFRSEAEILQTANATLPRLARKCDRRILAVIGRR